MKRDLTFEIKSIHPDYKIAVPKELEKRIGKPFKLIGDILVGNKLEMYFEDGFIYKTSALEIEGYINERNSLGELLFVTLLTKDIAFELDIVQKEIKIVLEEQLMII